MNELKCINKKDLVFENKPLRDRINTKLTLLDTDWMSYELEASFRVKTQGELDVKFTYYGSAEAEMHVTQKNKGRSQEYTYFFSWDIFEKYILKFMALHLEQWKNEEVFYGGDIAVEFYNEIIQLREKHARKKDEK